MDTKLIIYLDQNHWNRLEKVYFEKRNDSLAQKVLDTLIELKSQMKIKITSNDLIDIVSYIVPIAYLDVVVGENYFITLAKKEKLDKLYRCKLFSRMNDFYEFL